MKKSYEAKYHRLEEENWWFEARRDMILKLVGGLERRSRILEIGCSGGPLLLALAREGFANVRGVDISKKAIRLCRERGIRNASLMDGAKLKKFGDGKFDVIIASDILEHIKNDAVALAEWNRVLKTGGALVIFVPAFGFLWSAHDEANLHYRRYSERELVSSLERAGFAVEMSSYWNFSLFFPAALARLFQRLLKKKSGKDQLYELNPKVNAFLAGLLKLENGLVTCQSLPVGVSVFAVARKR